MARAPGTRAVGTSSTGTGLGRARTGSAPSAERDMPANLAPEDVRNGSGRPTPNRRRRAEAGPRRWWPSARRARPRRRSPNAWLSMDMTAGRGKRGLLADWGPELAPSHAGRLDWLLWRQPDHRCGAECLTRVRRSDTAALAQAPHGPAAGGRPTRAGRMKVPEVAARRRGLSAMRAMTGWPRGALVETPRRAAELRPRPSAGWNAVPLSGYRRVPPREWKCGEGRFPDWPYRLAAIIS